ncbi:DUF2513 domain-containing protein [Weissella bombi]|uniref:DUF2513 domain-containing protein n=1 Tax=Weissella bombi TaxID=1505725 RepID=UPI003AF2AF6C
MELELDNIRDILLDFEKNLKYNEPFELDSLITRASVLDISKNDYLYTLDKLLEGNLINCISNNNTIVSVVSITYEGHQLLEDIRNDDNWTKAKKTVNEAGVASISSIRAISKKITDELLIGMFPKRFHHYNYDEEDPSPYLYDYLESKDNDIANNRYTDSYNTGTNYTLRELLVLVWWLRPKNSRKINVKTPAYFVNVYSEDVHKITDKFINDKILYINDNNLVKPTVIGIMIYEKFSERLWEIHSKSNANIDDVFNDWNLQSYNIQMLKNSVSSNTQYLNFYNDMLLWEKRHDKNTTVTQLHIDYYVTEQERIKDKIQSLEHEFKSL